MRDDMEIAYLSLGSNLGDRLQQLRDAVRSIESFEGIEIEKISSVYETEPVGDVPQENFYNLVIKIKTDLSPYRLLAIAQIVERQFGRKREIHWGPRTLDIDILLYGREAINEKDLVIPHPEMYNRAFVLIPLIEIEPDLKLPGGNPPQHFLDRVKDQGVKKIGSLI